MQLVTSISFQRLSSLFLNELTDGASTTCWGSLFQTLTTRWLKCIGVCLSVCLSVSPSDTSVDFIQMAEDIVKLLSRPGSTIILVFRFQAPIPNSKGKTLQREAQSTRGWESFAIFDWNRGISWKRYEIGPWLLWNVNRKSYALYRTVTFSMTLTDP